MAGFSQRCLGFMLFGLVVGCSGGGGSSLYPLKGQVLLDGNPLTPKAGESAFIEFLADTKAGNTSNATPRSEIVAGAYEVKTNNQPGLPVGAWLVRVVYHIEPDPKGKNPYAPPTTLIHPRFGDPLKSDLKLDMKADGPKTQDFKVTKGN